MKKITFLLIITLALSFSVHAQFPEDFQGSATIPAGWSNFIGANGLGSIESWTISAGDNNIALVNWDEGVPVGEIAENWLVTPQITVDAAHSFMTFDLTDFNEGFYGSLITIRVSTKSQTTHADFATVGTVTEADITNTLSLQGFLLNLATDYLNQSIYVAFVMENNNGDAWALDNVNVVPNATAPNPVIAPNPTDGATISLAFDTDYNSDSVIDANDAAYTFTWEDALTGDAPSGYTFYLGASSPPTDPFDVSNKDFTLFGLSYSTTYYWQVVAYNVGGEAAGSSIWSFTTEADPNLSTEEQAFTKLKIYPNPTKDFIKIESNVTIDKISIINQLGQRVLELNKDRILNNRIDLSALSTGFYHLTVTSENKSRTIKIIKE